METAAKNAGEEVKELKKFDVTNIDPWESRIKFGKWVGTEIAKGALMMVGMKVVEATFQAVAKPTNGTASKEAKAASELARKSTEAMEIVKKILEAWNKWLIHNYLKRKSFGSVKAEGVSIWHYQVFQSQVADLNDERNGVVTKAATAASKSKKPADIKKLVKKENHLVKKIQVVSKWLEEKGENLTDSKLKLLKEDLQKALKLVSSSDDDGDDTGLAEGDGDGNNDNSNGSGDGNNN